MEERRMETHCLQDRGSERRIPGKREKGREGGKRGRVSSSSVDRDSGALSVDFCEKGRKFFHPPSPIHLEILR